MDFRELVLATKPIDAATTLSDLYDSIPFIIETFGFRYCSLVNWDRSSFVDRKSTVWHNYPAEWEKHYYLCNYFSKDPALQQVSSTRPIFLWQTASNSEVIAAASEFGISDGVTAVSRSVGTLTSISFSTFRSRTSKESVAAAVAIAAHLGNAIARFSNESRSDDAAHLTQRERECMLWVCEGKTTWEISQILSISERTVLFHMSNVQRKLQTCNRTHSATKSLALGLLE